MVSSIPSTTGPVGNEAAHLHVVELGEDGLIAGLLYFDDDVSDVVSWFATARPLFPLPRSRCSCTVSTAALMNIDWSRTISVE